MVNFLFFLKSNDFLIEIWYNVSSGIMKKVYILIVIFIVFIIGISIIGSIIVTGNVEILEEKDAIGIQTNREVYFTCYGYSIDNPNVIVNPYGNSPLTAIVMFETDDYSNVSITIKGKNDNDINYTFPKNKYHYIPIYGLYADYNNTVILTSENKTKEIDIKTESLPDDFEFSSSGSYGNFTFYNVNYPYAVDSNNDVRWYLNEKYYGNITFNSDSSIIIGSNRYDENGRAISIYKMNLLGKIFNEYLLENSYYGVNAIYNDNILVLSSDVLLIDLQTGELVDDIMENDNFTYLGNIDDKIVVCKDDTYYVVNENGLEEISYDTGANVNNFYDEINEYRIIPSNRYGLLNKTEMAKKKVSLLNYDKKMIDGVEITKEVERIRIENSTDDVVYLILDKFFDKRIYEINDIKYINLNGLSGKYTIYLMVNDKVYKTDYFVEV